MASSLPPSSGAGACPSRGRTTLVSLGNGLFQVMEGTTNVGTAIGFNSAGQNVLVIDLKDLRVGGLGIGLYGRPPMRFIGAGHGFAGNVYPFLRATALLPADQVALVAERALASLQATARQAHGGANWFPGINLRRPASWLPPVQDCHGAPGIVCRLATAPRTPDGDSLRCRPVH